MAELPCDSFELLQEISLRLEEAGIPDAGKEAELIITHFADIDRVSLWRDRPDIPRENLQEVQDAVERRVLREPLQYILGESEFWGLHIAVGPGVLVPRPETELIVEEALRFMDRKGEHNILDLCTGSGCLALALARELPESRVTGTDVSEYALDYAGRNAIINGLPNARFLHGSLFEPVLSERFDLIVSNPPYIVSAEIDTLQPEIREHEPIKALDGGPDGLDFYRDILIRSPEYLVTGGMIILELGMGQAGDVAKIAREAGMEVITVRNDLSGIERILAARLTS